MIAYSEFRQLEISVDGGVAVLTFTPVHEGGVEPSFFTEVRDAFAPLSMDRDVHAVVLTGKGDGFFTGLPATWTQEMVREGLASSAGQMLATRQIVDNILSFRKPLVAAVNGPSVSVGNQLALLCDAAVASETASFTDHHVPNGVAAGDGGTLLWPLLVGPALARDILLRGRSLSAAEALRLNLVAEIVEQPRTVPVAVELAQRLSALPGLAYSATKQTINNWWRQASVYAWDLALAYEAANLHDRG
jgi:enoyl-CoA hydratase